MSGPAENIPAEMLLFVQELYIEYFTQCQVLLLVARRLKRLPPTRETWVRSLGRDGPLEKEMVTHSSILA